MALPIRRGAWPTDPASFTRWVFAQADIPVQRPAELPTEDLEKGSKRLGFQLEDGYLVDPNYGHDMTLWRLNNEQYNLL